MRALVGALAMLLCAALTYYNWWALWQRHTAPERGAVLAPILGGLAGVGGLTLLPWDLPIWIRLLPLLFDYGSLPGLALFGWSMLNQMSVPGEE